MVIKYDASFAVIAVLSVPISLVSVSYTHLLLTGKVCDIQMLHQMYYCVIVHHVVFLFSHS